MDASLMPCKGQYCETTCQQWYRSILAPAGSVTVSCKEFSDFAFYPKGALIPLQSQQKRRLSLHPFTWSFLFYLFLK